MHQLLNGAPRLIAEPVPSGGKRMSASDAVRRFVPEGAVVGMGGQNINRCPLALAHEIMRQGIGDLTVVGCNLSLPVDLLVAAGLVRRTEQGSGNLERYGVLFNWRRLVERGEIEVADYSHLTMSSRFLAAAMGLPFLPTRSLLGTSVLEEHVTDGSACVFEDPWQGGPVVLVRALQPDVSIIHASVADTSGNVVIDGVTSHETSMVQASKSVIVSVEKIVTAGSFDVRPEMVTISGAYISAVVEQPSGAYPTSVYRHYDYDDAEIRRYQERARAGAAAMQEWMDWNVYGVASFDEYLDRQDHDGSLRRDLVAAMRRLM